MKKNAFAAFVILTAQVGALQANGHASPVGVVDSEIGQVLAAVSSGMTLEAMG
jgi:hypothetical protein